MNISLGIDIQAAPLHMFGIIPEYLAKLNKAGLNTTQDVVNALEYIYNNQYNTNDKTVIELQKALRISKNTTKDIFCSPMLEEEIFRLFDSTADTASINILVHKVKYPVQNLLIADTISQEGLCERCKVAIGSLNPQMRDIVILHWYCNIPVMRVAEMMNISYRAVEVNLRQAINLLRSEGLIDLILTSDTTVLRNKDVTLQGVDGVHIKNLGITKKSMDVLTSLGVFTVGQFFNLMESKAGIQNRKNQAYKNESYIGSILYKRHVNQFVITELISIYDKYNKLRLRISPLDIYDRNLRYVESIIAANRVVI